MRFAVSMVRSLEVKTMQNSVVLASNGDFVKSFRNIGCKDVFICYIEDLAKCEE